MRPISVSSSYAETVDHGNGRFSKDRREAEAENAVEGVDVTDEMVDVDMADVLDLLRA